MQTNVSLYLKHYISSNISRTIKVFDSILVLTIILNEYELELLLKNIKNMQNFSDFKSSSKPLLWTEPMRRKDFYSFLFSSHKVYVWWIEIGGYRSCLRYKLDQALSAAIMKRFYRLVLQLLSNTSSECMFALDMLPEESISC